MATQLDQILAEIDQINALSEEDLNSFLANPEDQKLLQDIDTYEKYGTFEPTQNEIKEKAVKPVDIVPDDPDSFTNRVGRSFNEFQKAMAEGVAVYGRLIGSKDIEEWGNKTAKEQEADIASYGMPKRTASLTEGFDQISKTYEDQGLGEAISRSATLLKDMTADALGSIGVPVAAGLAAAPIAAVGGVVGTIGTGLTILAPFITGGLAGTGQIKEEATRLGADEETSDKFAAGGGAVVGALDRIGAGMILKSLVENFGKDAVIKKFGEEIGEEAAKTAVEKGLSFAGKVTKGGLTAGLAEGVTETSQEFTQMAAAGLASDKGLVPYEGAEVTKRLVDAAALGFVGGKTLGTVTTAVGERMQTNAARRYEELEETIDKLSKAIVDKDKDIAITFAEEQPGVLGREKDKKRKEARDIVGGLFRGSLSFLGNLARDSQKGAELVTLLGSMINNVNANVGIDADKVKPVLNSLKSNFRIPILQREIPKSISRRIYKVLVDQKQDPDQKINDAAAEIRTFLGTQPINKITGALQKPAKVDPKALEKSVFSPEQKETGFGESEIPAFFRQPTGAEASIDLTTTDSSFLGKSVNDAIENQDIDQQTINDLDNRVSALRNQYLSRLEAAPQEQASIIADIKKSQEYKDLSNLTVFEPQYDGLFGKLKEAGVPINFELGYLPRVYKLGPINRRKFVKVLMNQGKSKAEATNIAENIEQNDGVYNPTESDIRLGQPKNERIKDSEISEQQRRKLSKEDVAALEKAGLVETDIQGLLYKYILDANRKLEAKKVADRGNQLIKELEEAKAISSAEKEHLFNVFNATQNNYKPLNNKKVQSLQKWMLTGQYILTLPLAGLTALSEPVIILSRTNPKYALFGAANASYNGLRAGLRKFFPKLPLNESEKAFQGILQGLDGALAERFGDIGGVTVSRKITNAFFKATLLTTMTQISRDMAFQATRMQMRDDLRTLKANRKNTKGYMQAKRRLLEQGITDPETESVQKWFEQVDSKASQPTEGDPEIIRKALSKTVDEFIMSPNALNRPLWMSNPHLASVAQLKGFMFTFGNTVGTRMFREVITPLTRGRIPAADAMKYAIALTGIMGVALFIQGLKDNIRYGDEESYFDRLDGKDKVLDALMRTNIFGAFTLIADALKSREYGSNFWASILGPAASTIEGVTSGAYDYILDGNSRNFTRQILNLIPILRNIPMARPIKAEIADKTQENLDDLRNYIVD